jgi:hypothetical protein
MLETTVTKKEEKNLVRVGRDFRRAAGESMLAFQDVFSRNVCHLKVS